jgi:DNA ligase (NAD+)
MNENKIEEIKVITAELQKYCEAYYKYDKPLVSDKSYDKLYDLLLKLEKETGFIMANSPTQKVQGEVIDKLKKVIHNTPMLSADKTQDINKIIKFCGDKKVVLSFKLDGLTLVLRYNNGKFIQAITRGSGTEGEDVTHNFKFCKNIPLEIPYKDFLEIRGEGIVSWENFNLINSDLDEEDKYSHPRSLASGSVRQLDSNIFKDRQVEFYAFKVVESSLNFETKTEQLMWLSNQGFPVIEFANCHSNIIEALIKDNKFNREIYKYPTDGHIIEFDDLEYAKSLGVDVEFLGRLGDEEKAKRLSFGHFSNTYQSWSTRS